MWRERLLEETQQKIDTARNMLDFIEQNQINLDFINEADSANNFRLALNRRIEYLQAHYDRHVAPQDRMENGTA